MSKLKWHIDSVNIDKLGVETSKLVLVWNKMRDNLFFALAHTPLQLHQIIEKSCSKIIICCSWHSFQVLWRKLTDSGLVIRNNLLWVNNALILLQENPEAVLLVSQIAKKYLDKQSLIQEYKSRIFCLIHQKQWITNHLVDTRKYRIKKKTVYYKKSK